MTEFSFLGELYF